MNMICDWISVQMACFSIYLHKMHLMVFFHINFSQCKKNESLLSVVSHIVHHYEKYGPNNEKWGRQSIQREVHIFRRKNCAFWKKQLCILEEKKILKIFKMHILSARFSCMENFWIFSFFSNFIRTMHSFSIRFVLQFYWMTLSFPFFFKF